ncbi:lysM and putative peptidoglycan-binding domain-containing protein 2 [Drosophila innubila]|uniref:lysM and putative peptidoglycan-binding domain-containing protein 2 n=1 Tax=Drosophila innubila TaxID=198719 RepID=UPI00148BE8A7|nr:lysM and putative peptidoglycan-binding domain-containing protein 2 [Drosophila innubila]
MSSGSSKEIAPNLEGCKFWLRHEVSSEDTMVHLASKYGTTIGQLCRANRMHCQDVIQMRRHIWLPLVQRENRRQQQSPLQSLPIGIEVLKAYAKVVTLPPHFYRQSTPNVDDFAGECDPLLITTKCM